MLNIEKKYVVKDKNSVTWGNVTLKYSKYDSLHGYLNPTDDFKDVFELFKRHEEIMNENGEVNDELKKTGKEIANLGVEFIDVDSQEVVKPGIVFVSQAKKGLLLTCDNEKEI